uniref:rhomboid family intramembrane serine protease n=1 Tax=Flavobacterium sp. TaxID=239 RepID=UPI00404941D8
MRFFDELKLQYKIGGVPEKLIYWNVALFAIPYVIQGLLSLFKIGFDFEQFVSMSSNPADLLWKPWSIITYSFFHATFLHILSNLIVLHFSSRLFLTFFTQKQLLGVYLQGAIFGALFFLISYFVFPKFSGMNHPMVGASAAVSAVLFAIAIYAPQMQIRLLLIGNVKLWHIAIVFFVLDLIRLSGTNAGGHIAHIGGVFLGYLFISQLKKGNDVTKWVSATIDYFTNLGKPKPLRKVYKSENPTTYSRTATTKTPNQKQIDAILDKISQSGYDSLTKEEKEFLFKAGK